MAVFDFLKGVFKKEETTPDIIRIDSIPEILDNAEKELDSRIRGGTTDGMEKIMHARQKLLDLVESLLSAEREEASHPKLEKIATNTLPLFIKSMLTALNRELPGEPEEFYLAATECLKGCIKSQAGPGRYLQGVFPDEMKAIRAAIGTIGKEMNSMTPIISEARETRDLIRTCREMHRDLLDRIEEKAFFEMQIPEFERDLLEQKEDFTKVSDELCRLVEGDEAKTLQDLRKQEECARDELAGIERQLRAVFSNISHVLRKGEKIIQRGEGGRAPKEMHICIELLSGGEIPAWNDLEGSIGSVLPVVFSMIASGDIVLKNKEEKSLFSDPSAIHSTISGLYAKWTGAKENITEISERYRKNPHKARILSLEGAIEERKRRILESEENLHKVKETVEKAKSALPELSGELEKRMERLTGERIILDASPGSLNRRP